MTLAVSPETIPLQAGSDGVVRIAGTRVTLDTVVGAFHDGATPEAIVQQYPSLALADVYAVIGYYLRHQDEVTTYLHARQVEATQIRANNEARFNPVGVRERLLARRQS
ncbi:MAG: DUF433 domain-containing protein [Oscillochloridaceae bacterium umkhey_bin13]